MSGSSQEVLDVNGDHGRVGRSNPVIFSRNLTKKKRNTKRCTCECHHNHGPQRIREQGFISSTACHAVYFFLIQSLIGILQVNSQSKDDSPFQTHPAKMGISVTAICIYASAVLLKINVQMHHGSCSLICKNVILICGVLSPISLLSVLVPNWFSWLMFIAWAFLPTTMVCELLRHVWQRLYEKGVNAIWKTINMFRRLRGSRLMEQLHFLV